MSGGKRADGRRRSMGVGDMGVGDMGVGDMGVLAALAVAKARRWLAVFCAWEQLSDYQQYIEEAGGRYVRCCGWEKPDSTPQLSGDRPATWGECLVIGHAARGAMRWNAGGKRGLYRAHVCRGEQRSEHPTQKPLNLMLDLVTDFTDPGDLICDPFAGSGTTGVACLRLGRRFIGWEKDPAYFEIACRRLRGDEAKPNPAQPSLFDRPPEAA
jgi:site-specific DNA-methyltransferase (adenine-specific)